MNGDPTRFVAPGGDLRADPTLEHVGLSPARQLLGNGVRDIGGRDGILDRFSAGLMEVGGVESPLLRDGVQLTLAIAGPFEIGLTVPNGQTWRVRAAGVRVVDALGGIAPAPLLAIAVLPRGMHATLGTVFGTVGVARAGAAFPSDVPLLATDVTNSGIIGVPLEVALFPGDTIAALGDTVAVNDVASFAVAYQVFPRGARPPY